MQNNNSKLNTVLFIIVIILLAIGIWMLAVNDKVSDRIESDTETSVVEDVVVKEEAKPVTQPVSKTYSYPQMGPAFITIDSQNNPTVSYDKNANSLVFSGSLGTDTIMYTPNVMAGFYPCIDFNLQTVEASYGGIKYQVCSHYGNTYFYKDGFESTGVVVKSSGTNLSDPHYADLSTLAFPMEGEN